MAAAIGSAEWWGTTVDKLETFGLSALSTALNVGKPVKAGETTPGTSIATSSVQGMLPYIAGGLVLVGIVVMLSKRK